MSIAHQNRAKWFRIVNIRMSKVTKYNEKFLITRRDFRRCTDEMP